MPLIEYTSDFFSKNIMRHLLRSKPAGAICVLCISSILFFAAIFIEICRAISKMFLRYWTFFSVWSMKTCLSWLQYAHISKMMLSSSSVCNIDWRTFAFWMICSSFKIRMTNSSHLSNFFKTYGFLRVFNSSNDSRLYSLSLSLNNFYSASVGRSATNLNKSSFSISPPTPSLIYDKKSSIFSGCKNGVFVSIEFKAHVRARSKS